MGVRDTNRGHLTKLLNVFPSPPRMWGMRIAYKSSVDKSQIEVGVNFAPIWNLLRHIAGC